MPAITANGFKVGTATGVSYDNLQPIFSATGTLAAQGSVVGEIFDPTGEFVYRPATPSQISGQAWQIDFDLSKVNDNGWAFTGDQYFTLRVTYFSGTPPNTFASVSPITVRFP
jgi:hypothetical protein